MLAAAGGAAPVRTHSAGLGRHPCQEDALEPGSLERREPRLLVWRRGPGDWGYQLMPLAAASAFSSR